MTREEVADLRAALSKGSDETILEAVRQAESFLAAQLQAGLASDARAMNMAVVTAAILSFLVGGTATMLASDKVTLGWHLATAIELIGSFGVSLWFAVQAAKPTDFDYAGSSPRFWRKDALEKRPLVQSLAAQAAQYADGISCNAIVLTQSHSRQKWALNIMGLGLVGAVAIEGLILFIFVAKNGFRALS